MPADKYSFRPTPAQMSFAMVVTHLAQGNDYLCGKIGGRTAAAGIGAGALKIGCGLTGPWICGMSCCGLPLPVFVDLKGECPGGGVVSVRTPTGYGFEGRPAPWEIAKDSAAEALAKVASGEYSWGAN